MHKTAKYHHFWKSRLKDTHIYTRYTTLERGRSTDVTTSLAELETSSISQNNWVHLLLTINKKFIVR